jgi:predicted RNA binding protein YcfA (HicA-like mRNA interferase family)
MTLRLLPVSGADMVRVFKKIGFFVTRQKGSHIVMSRGEEVLIIPNHDTVLKGTERDLIKDAGLTVKEFKRLL